MTIQSTPQTRTVAEKRKFEVTTMDCDSLQKYLNLDCQLDQLQPKTEAKKPSVSRISENIPKDLWKDITSQISYDPDICSNPFGKNGSSLLCKYGKPIVVIKPEEHEIGTIIEFIKRNRYLPLNSEEVLTRPGYAAGDGSFSECFCYEYIKSLLDPLPKLIRPKVTLAPTDYGTVTSKNLFCYITLPIYRRLVEKKCALIQFIPYYFPIEDIKKTCDKLDVATVQFIVMIYCALMNTDGSSENAMVNNGGYILLYDYGFCLPAKAETGLKCFLFDSPQAKKPILEGIKRIIQNLSALSLIEIIDKYKKKGVQKATDFNFERIKTHALALQILKEGAKQDLSLYEIAILLVNSTRKGIASETLSPGNIIHYFLSTPNETRSLEEIISDYKQALDKLKTQNLDEQLSAEAYLKAKHDILQTTSHQVSMPSLSENLKTLPILIYRYSLRIFQYCFSLR